MGYSDAYPGGYGALTADPAVAVELETTSDVWEDLGADVLDAQISRGRQRELDRYRAGTCTLTLENSTRRYDPANAASDLTGHILPMKRLRVTAAWAGESYPLFAGFVDRWAQERTGPHSGRTTVSATDGFKVLERAELAPSVYAQLVAEDGPVAWWRLDEQGGTVAYDSVGDVDLTRRGTATLGAGTLVARDPGGSAVLDDTVTFDDGFLKETITLPISGGPLTCEAVIQSATGDVGDGLVVGNVTYFAGTGFALLTDAGTGFAVITTPGSVTATGISGSPIAEDGTVHHVCGVWNADNTVKLYVDGVNRTVGTPSLAIGSFNQPNGYVVIGAFDEDGMVGGVDEVAFYDYALTPAQILAHADAVSAPWDGDTVDERIDRVLDAVGWTAGRDLDVSSTTLIPAELNTSALEHAQKAAQSDFGLLYITGDGTVRFENRDSIVNQPVLAEFSDEAGSDLAVTFSAPEISDEDLRNSVTVSRLEGVAQHAEDAASIAAYQRASYTVEGLYHDDDALSRGAAEWIVAEYANPKDRVDKVTVMPGADPDNLWPAVLGRELTDRVQLTETPQNTGDPWTKTLVVEGITHTFGPKAWETMLDLSPAYAADSCVLQLDTGECGLDEARLFF